MATDSWITQGNGNWSVASNWSLGRAPIASDNVQIDVPGLNITVVYTGTAQLTINNLVNNEYLDISSGSVSWTGGVWDGSGTVEIDSTLAMSGSADKVMRDGITLLDQGIVTLSGTGDIVGQVGATITNHGVFNVESDASITFPTGVGDGVFNNGGLFEKTGGGTAAGDMTEVGGAQGFTFNNSDNNTYPVIPGDCQVLVGTLDLGDNQNASLTQGGTFEISANATLEYDRGTENIITYTNPITNQFFPSSITGLGRVLIAGGTLGHWGNFAVHRLDMESGQFLLNQNFDNLSETTQRYTGAPVISAGTTDIFNFDGGTFGGSGGGIFPTSVGPEEYQCLIVGTTFSWTGGTFTGIGRLLLNTTCTNATITTTNPKAITGGFGVDLLDELLWQDSSTIDITGSSAIWIHANGTLWDQGNGTITAEGDVGNVWNSGNFLKQDGVGVTTIDLGISFINAAGWAGSTGIPPLYFQLDGFGPLPAQIDIRSGTVLFNGDLTNSDNILIHPASTLNLQAGTDINGTNGDLSNPAKILGVDGGGTLILGGDTFTGDNRARLDVPNVTFGGGIYQFNNLAPGAQLVTTAVFTGGTTGAIGGSGTLEVGIDPNNPPVPLVPATFLWNSGEFVGAATTSTLLIDDNAILTIPSGDRTTINDSIDNRGTIQWTTSPGLLAIDGNFDQTATGVFDCVIEAGSPALDSLAVAGTITLDGTLNLSDVTPPQDTEVFQLIANFGSVPATGIFIGLPEGTAITVGAAVYTISYVGDADGLDVTLTAAVLPTVTIETPAAIIEPTSGTQNLLFEVDLSQSVAHTVTVNYTTSNVTATAGVDYTATTGTLTIPAGTSQDSIEVPIIGSTAVKPTETFNVSLSGVVGGLLGTPNTAVGTILNENGPPVFTFSSATYTALDNSGEAVITVIRTDSPTIPVTVDYATTPGTATPGVNYTPEAGTLAFGVNITTLTFQVPVINDEVFGGNATANGDVTFNVVLANPEGDNSTLGTPSSAVVTVVETTLPSITVSNATAVIPTTGTASLNFTVSVQPNPDTVEVDYTTTDGTALAGTDYTAQSGTLTFVAGQTSQVVSVTLLPDTAVTANKEMTLNLSNSVSGTITVPYGVGTLVNDNLPIVSIADTSVTEPLGGETNAVFTVSLNTAPFQPVTVDYGSADGTGTAGVDYVAESGTVTLAVGQTTAQIDVPVNTTFSTAAGENFSVSLANPTEAVLGTADATGSIVNLPVHTATFSAAKAFHYTGAPDNQITVGLTGPGSGVITYLGLLINDVKEIALTGTTAASTFSIRTSQPRAFLVNLSDTGPLKSVVAPTTSLQGNLNIAGGVGKIQMASLLGGNTLTIGAATAGLSALTASFAGTVTDATLNTAMPLTTLRVGSASGFDVTAPSATSISSTGNFTANVLLTGSLGTLRVGQSLTGSDINVAGSIGTVTAGSIVDSTIFAGVAAGVTTLPTTSTQFTGSTSSIGQVTVRSTFGSSLIAAPIIGNVSLATVTTDNGGVSFGVAGGSISSVRGKGDVVVRQAQASLVASPFSDADFVIRLTVQD